MEVKDTVEEKIAKKLIAFPKSFKCVQILPNGYIIQTEGKTFKIECKEIVRKK